MSLRLFSSATDDPSSSSENDSAESERLTPEEKHRRSLKRAERLRAEGDDETRIRFLHEKRWVSYPRAKELLRLLEDLYTRPKRDRPRSLLIVARAGNGKTSIGKRFRRKHPPSDNRGEAFIRYPVLYMQAPWEPHPGRFYHKVLSELNDPPSSGDSAPRKERRAYEMMEKVGVRMLIIDEVQHILAGSGKLYQKMLNLIKYMSTELRIPIVALGTRESVPAIQADPQIATRFRVEPLPKWKLEEGQRKKFLRLIISLEQLLPLKKESGLKQEKLARKILAMSEGTIGEIDEVLTLASIEAIKSGEERITRKVLDNCGWRPPSDQKQRTRRAA